MAFLEFMRLSSINYTVLCYVFEGYCWSKRCWLIFFVYVLRNVEITFLGVIKVNCALHLIKLCVLSEHA